MADRVYLGVDLGAESGRVVAGAFDGRRVRLDEVHRFPNVPVRADGVLRWDIETLWAELLHGLSGAAGRYGNAIVSVGVDAWGVDYGLLDAAGELLAPPAHYRDGRTVGVMERATERMSREEVFTATGVQFQPFNTLYQLLAEPPDRLARAERLLLIPDLFHYRLCGPTAVEATAASTTQCFDPATGTWATDLLDRLRLPTHLLGPVVPPGTILGTLTPAVRSATGLGAINVVAPACHDTASAVAAVPADRPGWAFVSSGTWSLVGVELPTGIRSAAALGYNLTNEGGVDGTVRLLANVSGLWLVQRCRAAFGLGYDELTAAAEAVPNSRRAVIDPDHPRFLAPADMPAEIAAACREVGQPVPATPGEVVRCCLDSLAVRYRLTLDRLEAVTGTPVEVVHVVGGGARNRLLNQLTADACGRPVVAGPVEATALGNILVQAWAAGELGSLAELRAVVRASVPTETFAPRAG